MLRHWLLKLDVSLGCILFSNIELEAFHRFHQVFCVSFKKLMYKEGGKRWFRRKTILCGDKFLLKNATSDIRYHLLWKWNEDMRHLSTLSGFCQIKDPRVFRGHPNSRKRHFFICPMSKMTELHQKT